MKIGKGLIKWDDYISFGKLIDELLNQCYYLAISPKKGRLYAWCKKERCKEVEKRLEGKDYSKTKISNALYLYKISLK